MKAGFTFCLVVCSLLLPLNRADGQQKIFNLILDDKSSHAGGIICIAQDHQGYMWFGSQLGGLLRYDGSTFTSITNNPQNPNSLAGNSQKRYV